MKTRMLFQPFAGALMLCGMLLTTVASHADETWQALLKRQVPLMGYHNWIVITDAAYPWQTAPGIQSVATGADQLTVVKAVLEAVRQSKSVRPLVQTDSELQYLSARDAPSITAYRERLKRLVGADQSPSLPHEQLISTIAEAGQTFHVLLLKTKSTLPYSSVFVQLTAAYWTPQAEQRLRAAMPATASPGGPSYAGGPNAGPRNGGPRNAGAPNDGQFGGNAAPPGFRPRGRRGRD